MAKKSPRTGQIPRAGHAGKGGFTIACVPVPPVAGQLPCVQPPHPFAVVASGERVEAAMAIELPVEGFPISADEIRRWFLDRNHREPSAEELYGIINAMTAREATPPVAETGTERSGWHVGHDWVTR